MPDLLNYWLTGERVCEFTNATTTQLFDPRAACLGDGAPRAAGHPGPLLFPEVVQPGTSWGTYASCPGIAPATHDTGSAVAAVPATTQNLAFISSGTWSLVGLDVDRAGHQRRGLAANVTNEGGVDTPSGC